MHKSVLLETDYVKESRFQQKINLFNMSIVYTTRNSACPVAKPKYLQFWHCHLKNCKK